jgi:hypothetical protein
MRSFSKYCQAVVESGLLERQVGAPTFPAQWNRLAGSAP